MSAFRGGRSGGGGPPRGQFLNGVWHCDCNPRLPAVHFETKKPGPNQGKWFRTCQKPQEERCPFFLWDHHAQAREKSALTNNSRTEPAPADPALTNPVTPSKRPPSPPPPYTIQTNPSTSSRKRSRPITDVLDEYGLGQVDDDDLNEVMVQAETPSKPARRTNFTTPAPKRQKLPWETVSASSSRENGLQTPQTDGRTPGDPFALKHPTPAGVLFTPTSRADADEHQQIATPSSSFETPTPGRFRNAVNEDIVKDVFELLKNGSVRLPEHTEQELRTLLARHAKNAEGYRRGRDVIRTTVKAKDAKITELTYRVNTVEAELEAEKAMVKHLQWEAQNETDT